MRRGAPRLSSAALAVAALIGAGPRANAIEPERPRVTRERSGTSSATPPLTREERELARYLDVLSNLETLEALEWIELMPVMEDDDAR